MWTQPSRSIALYFSLKFFSLFLPLLCAVYNIRNEFFFFFFWNYLSTLFHYCIATDDLTFNFGKGQKKKFLLWAIQQIFFWQECPVGKLERQKLLYQKGVCCMRWRSPRQNQHVLPPLTSSSGKTKWRTCRFYICIVFYWQTHEHKLV